MLDYLKRLLNRNKETTLLEDIEHIKKALLKDKLDLYGSPWNNTNGLFLERDIIDTINRYKYINKFPIESQHIQVGSISEHNYKSMLYSTWFTSNGKIILNKNEVLLEWLDEGAKLVRLYEFRITLVNIKNNSYANAKKISPYYRDLSEIVRKIKNNI